MSTQNLTAKDIIRTVTQKLSLRNVRTKSETFGDFYFGGKYLFRVKMPNEHGARTSVSPGLLKACRESAFLNSGEYADLVRCPISSEKYLELLHEKGIIKG
jgi:hypothetical protein